MVFNFAQFCCVALKPQIYVALYRFPKKSVFYRFADIVPTSPKSEHLQRHHTKYRYQSRRIRVVNHRDDRCSDILPIRIAISIETIDFLISQKFLEHPSYRLVVHHTYVLLRTLQTLFDALLAALIKSFPDVFTFYIHNITTISSQVFVGITSFKGFVNAITVYSKAAVLF